MPGRHRAAALASRSRSPDRPRHSVALAARIVLAVAILLPLGVLLGIPLPGGMRLLAARRPDIIPWGWGLNGAFSVVGATLAVFIAMNWGFISTCRIAGTVLTKAAAPCPNIVGSASRNAFGQQMPFLPAH